MNIKDAAAEAVHASICEQSLDDCMDPDWRGRCVKAVEAAAPHLMAPRIITTATELDALRRFTVIRSAEGIVYEKQTMWHEAGSRDLVYWPAIALPVIILQEGWGDE
jgi:hypothetical protein